MERIGTSRSKLRSLEGVEVILHTLDGVKMESRTLCVFEEVSDYGLLIRSKDGHLVYASTAAFTVAVKSD